MLVCPHVFGCRSMENGQPFRSEVQPACICWVLSRVRPVDKVNFAERKRGKADDIFVSDDNLRENEWPEMTLKL